MSGSGEFAVTWDLFPPVEAHTPSVRRLYSAPPPIAGEAPSSWAYRIAARYAWSPRHIRRLFHWVGSGTPFFDFASAPFFDISHIAFITLHADAVVAACLAWGYPTLSPDSFLSCHSDKSPIYRFCGQCLKEDTVPYIRLQWRLTTTTVCDRHQAMLTEHCPACSGSIDLGRERRVDLPDWARRQSVRYCRRCKVSLTNDKPVSPPHSLLQVLSNFQQLALKNLSCELSPSSTSGIPITRDFLEPYFMKACVKKFPKWLPRMEPYAIDWRSVVGASHYDLFRELSHGRLET